MAEIYNEMLIRNVDCGLLYFQIKDDEAIKEYEDLKKEKNAIENRDSLDDKRLVEVQKRIEELSKEIFSMKKKINLSDKNNRFYYSGTIADSLMGRKFRQVAKGREEYDKVIKTVGDSDYTDLIINLKFKQDIMIPDDSPVKVYDPETKSIVETDRKKRASCGDTIETSIINGFECYCQRYGDGEELYGMRSPHICTGNNALLRNTYRHEWNKWFNLTDNILVINLWGKGAFLSCKWNGSDQDSDTAFIGNNSIILEKVKAVQDYLIPINCVPQESKYYEFTNENMSKVDGKLCNDMIGKICNLARDLSSFYWHLFNNGSAENKQKYLPMIYDDISILEVLSNIAIDSAKRQYDCNIETEMKKIKSRPYMTSQGAVIQNDKIIFKETRYKKSLSKDKIADYEDYLKDREKATTQEEIDIINKRIEGILKTEDVYMIRPDFTKDLKSQPKKKKRKKYENEEQRELHRQKQKAYVLEQKALKEKVYRKLQSPMDLLNPDYS